MIELLVGFVTIASFGFLNWFLKRKFGVDVLINLIFVVWVIAICTMVCLAIGTIVIAIFKWAT